jgi:hypothetical protein
MIRAQYALFVVNGAKMGLFSGCERKKEVLCTNNVA